MRPTSQPTFREVAKEARSPAKTRKVSVFFGGHKEVLESESERFKTLLKAPNIDVVRAHSGKIVAVRLLSFDDQRGHSGERHGRSTVTTERVRNDDGILVGGDCNLKHKAENVTRVEPRLGWEFKGNRGLINTRAKQ
jgi:hypothetical protein